MIRQWANWFRRRKLESGLDRELSYHLERRTADFEKSGMSPEAARRQALLEVGGIAQVQEEVRDIWLSRWLRDFVYDFRFSARSFFRTPAFSVTAVLSLVLGIGATTAIYSLVDQVLLHALPVRQPERLVLIDWPDDPVFNGFGSWNLMSYPICRDLDEQKQFFSGVFCRALTTVNLSSGSDYHPATAEIVSGNYFTVLGIGPALGSVIEQDNDHVPDGNPVAVISYDLWQTQFGSASDVIGRKILVNRHPLTVIGVAAATFKGIDVGEVPSIWMPASMASQAIPGFDKLLDRRTRWMQVFGSLNQGVTLQEARVGLQPWFKAMLQEDTRLPSFPLVTPEKRQAFLNSTLVLTEAPQGHSTLRRRLMKPLWVLFAVTAVLLGLACLNVSGLFLARGSARDREIATRLALGASPWRIGRQFFADSLVIALAGGLLGIAVAPIAVRILIAFIPREAAPTALRAGLDWRLLCFAFLTSIAAGLLSGLAPAVQAGRRSVAQSLRERGGTAFGGVRLRKIIVTAEVALTMTLVVGAALFLRSLDALIAKGPGFATSSLVSFGVDSLRNGYSQAEGNRLMRRIDEAIRESSITQSSAIARFALLTGGSWNSRMTIFSEKRIPSSRLVNLNSVTPDFFKTMGIQIVAGRNFDARDVREPSEESAATPSSLPGYRSAIVNEAFVKRYLEGRNPLGVRIGEGDGPDAKPSIEIVGVMSDFSYRGLREESEQAFYPYFEDEGTSGTFYVKVRGAPESFVTSLRAIVHDIDPRLAITDLRTVNEQLDRSLNTEHLMATLSSSFGTLALLLSLVGLYGVMSFVVTQRTREIGIRLALGATRWSAIWLVLRDASAMILMGIGIGLLFVLAMGRLVQTQLYDVKSFDPTAIVITVVILSSTAAGAAFIPARRASGVSPTDALRAE